MDGKDIFRRALQATAGIRGITSVEEVRLLMNRFGNPGHSLFFRKARKQLARHERFFDTVQSQPLTVLQRLAVLLDERRNLVVAGAGTGKTSVIAAKVGYLLEEGLARPDDLLLLAYNTRAAAEMRDRLEARLGVDVAVRTFHAFGNEVLGQVQGTKLPVSPMATDRRQAARFLALTLTQLYEREDDRKLLITYFRKYLKPYRPPTEFKSEREYRAYTHSLKFKTLAGETVKSHGELDIANYLFCQGVRYEYEAAYKGHLPRNSRRRTYQPDFYLPDHDTYIEYYGIDREGKTAPWIDAVEYMEGIRWKRELHKTNETRLIEIESFHRQEGHLESVLETKLTTRGVQFKPLCHEQILDAAKDQGYQNDFLKLVTTFIEHARSNGWNFGQLVARSLTLPEKDRSKAFLFLFRQFLQAYTDELKRTQSIDFSDMVTLATRAMTTGQWVSPFKYILIDEFQDISSGRYKLIDALLQKNETVQLFAVGDDWQSIYRFAGSDISLMTKFRKHFGRATVMFLDRTFRFNSSIEQTSSKFVTQNPRQLKKRLAPTVEEKSPRVHIHWRVEIDETTIEAVVTRMSQQYSAKAGDLLVLGRYRHDLPDEGCLARLRRVWPSGEVTASTIHSAKGSEADYVLITDIVSGKYGFPSEIEDDPLLDLVLAEPEAFPAAEERRLFYVALTRARHAVHMLASEAEPSSFALELKHPSYGVMHDEADRKYRCPRCRLGVLRGRRTGRFGCSAFPDCEYTAPVCPECKKGFLWHDPDDSRAVHRCSNDACSGTAPGCPRCDVGALVPRTGKHGPFVGCSDWPRCEFKPPVSDRSNLKRYATGKKRV